MTAKVQKTQHNYPAERKQRQEVVVDERTKASTKFGYARAKELNAAIERGVQLELGPLDWAALGAILGWQLGGTKPTLRLVHAALQEVVPKSELPAEGSFYMRLYRAGASTGQFVVCHREKHQAMWLEVTPALQWYWEQALATVREATGE